MEPAASPTEQPCEPKPDYAAIARRALEARKADAKVCDRPVWFLDGAGNEYSEEAWVERLAKDTEKPEKPEDVVELEAVGGPLNHRTYNWNLTWMPRIAVEHLDAKRFIHVLEAVHALVDEATLMFHPGDLQVRVMNPSHVAMAEVKLPASWFEEYSVEKPFKVGVNVAELLKRLPKVRSKDDRLRIETLLDARRVTWTVQTRSLRRGLTTALLSLGEEEIPKVNVAFTAEAYMTLEALATIVDDVARVSENVRLLANAADRTLTFEAPGYEGDYRTQLDRSHEDLLSLTAKEDAKTTIALNYLGQIVKTLRLLTETVYLSLANSMPLRVKADLNQAAIEFYIAPYIE